MEVQLIREGIRLEQPLGVARAEAVVDGDVTLPGGLREEARVLAAKAVAAVEKAEPMNDHVNVRGRVVFHVLYTQGDPTKVNAIEASADFSQLLDLPGCHQKAWTHADAAVRRVEARAINGRLTLRAEVETTARASSLAPVEAITDVNGSDDAQVRTSQLSICRMAAQGSCDALLREELTLPAEMQIRETLFAEGHPVLEAVTGGLGRIGLTGQVLLEAVHASELPGRPVVITRHSIPFAESVEISGEDGDHLKGRVTVKDVAVASQDDGSGSQTLRAEVLLGITGWADATENLSILTDAYTTQGDDLILSSQAIACRTGSRGINAAESGKTTLILPDNAPPVRTMLAAFAHPRLSHLEASAGRTAVTGTIDATLLYMTDGSDAPVSIRMSEPFRVMFNEGIQPDTPVMLAATSVEAVPVTSDRAELRYILRMQAQEDQADKVQLVTDGRIVPAKAVTEDVVLYFTQPGDTLWDIARRYRIPVEGVRALNPDMTGEPRSGQGVVVWRHNAAVGG